MLSGLYNGRHKTNSEGFTGLNIDSIERTLSDAIKERDHFLKST